jgi:hypothetical protein
MMDIFSSMMNKGQGNEQKWKEKTFREKTLKIFYKSFSKLNQTWIKYSFFPIICYLGLDSYEELFSLVGALIPISQNL